MDNSQLQVLNFYFQFLVIMMEILNQINPVRRWWVKPHLEIGRRNQLSAYATIFTEFKLNDHEEFYKYCGMTLPQFIHLYGLVGDRLKKNSPRALSPEFRLVAVLK